MGDMAPRENLSRAARKLWDGVLRSQLQSTAHDGDPACFPSFLEKSGKIYVVVQAFRGLNASDGRRI